MQSLTSRAPSVRFHYRDITLPTSPKSSFGPDTPLPRKSVSSMISPERFDPDHSFYNFQKRKGYISSIEIDPEIAADLTKIT